MSVILPPTDVTNHVCSNQIPYCSLEAQILFTELGDRALMLGLCSKSLYIGYCEELDSGRVRGFILRFVEKVTRALLEYGVVLLKLPSADFDVDIVLDRIKVEVEGYGSQHTPLLVLKVERKTQSSSVRGKLDVVIYLTSRGFGGTSTHNELDSEDYIIDTAPIPRPKVMYTEKYGVITRKDVSPEKDILNYLNIFVNRQEPKVVGYNKIQTDKYNPQAYLVKNVKLGPTFHGEKTPHRICKGNPVFKISPTFGYRDSVFHKYPLIDISNRVITDKCFPLETSSSLVPRLVEMFTMYSKILLIVNSTDTAKHYHKVMRQFCMTYKLAKSPKPAEWFNNCKKKCLLISQLDSLVDLKQKASSVDEFKLSCDTIVLGCGLVRYHYSEMVAVLKSVIEDPLNTTRVAAHPNLPYHTVTHSREDHRVLEYLLYDLESDIDLFKRQTRVSYPQRIKPWETPKEPSIMLTNNTQDNTNRLGRVKPRACSEPITGHPTDLSKASPALVNCVDTFESIRSKIKAIRRDLDLNNPANNTGVSTIFRVYTYHFSRRDMRHVYGQTEVDLIFPFIKPFKDPIVIHAARRTKINKVRRILRRGEVRLLGGGVAKLNKLT